MTNKQKSIDGVIASKVQQDKEKFSFVNECVKCKNVPEGKFCSRDCYYKSKFDFRSSYVKHAPLSALEYFKIEKEKEDEFLNFLQGLIELYY